MKLDDIDRDRYTMAMMAMGMGLGLVMRLHRDACGYSGKECEHSEDIVELKRIVYRVMGLNDEALHAEDPHE